ncbi:SEL1-like repeat protein [Aeromonas hydrophila]|uniref:hypothetical protein n=1 Tax=Aeromonas hydrophila TaxID=644 RepID=UPI0005A93340|nr:hypothetical protein [Aeromonas hydrophila]
MNKTVLAFLLVGICFGGTTVQAEEEIHLAADQGAASTDAYFRGMYYYSDGPKQAYHQALTWIRKAAEQAVVHAQYNLGEPDATALADAQTLAGQYFEKYLPK